MKNFFLFECFFIVRIAFANKTQAYSIRHEAYGTGHHREGRNLYFTLVFAGVAVMAAAFVGMVVSRWRLARHPHAQGFVEVDQASFFGWCWMVCFI